MSKAYAGRQTPRMRQAKDELFKWFLIGAFAAVAFIVALFPVIRPYLVESANTVPWMLSGLSLLSMVFVVCLPSLCLFLACILVGVRRFFAVAESSSHPPR